MATPLWYTHGLEHLMAGDIDMNTATIKLMLCTSSYTPNQQTDEFIDLPDAYEASGGSGYPAGGFTLATLVVSSATLTASWDAYDISQAITGGPLAFRYGVFYKYVGTPATDPLIGYVDFGAQSVTDATLNITLTSPFTITAST